MEILGKLFGSESRVKILRLFLFNPTTSFSSQEVAARSMSDLYSAKHELKLLRKINFVRQVAGGDRKPRAPRRLPVGRHGGARGRATPAARDGWAFNDSFAYRAPLERLLLDTVFLNDADLYQKFAGAGKLKLIIVAGVFAHDAESRLDILIAGDNLKRHAIDATVRGLEALIGKELAYAVFETRDLMYRLGMYDRLVRDVMERPHKTLLDKMNFEQKFAEATARK